MTDSTISLTEGMFSSPLGAIRASDIAAIIANATVLTGPSGWLYLEVDLETGEDERLTAAVRGLSARSWVAVRASCPGPQAPDSAVPTMTATAVPLASVDHVDQVADQPNAPVYGVSGAWRLRFSDGVAHTIGRHLNEKRSPQQFTRTAYGNLTGAVGAITARW